MTQTILRKKEDPKPEPKARGNAYRRCANDSCGQRSAKAGYTTFLDTKDDGVCPTCGTEGAKLIFRAGT